VRRVAECVQDRLRPATPADTRHGSVTTSRVFSMERCSYFPPQHPFWEKAVFPLPCAHLSPSWSHPFPWACIEDDAVLREGRCNNVQYYAAVRGISKPCMTQDTHSVRCFYPLPPKVGPAES